MALPSQANGGHYVSTLMDVSRGRCLTDSLTPPPVDLRSVSFLNGVAAPRIYETTQQLISFWREKVRLAQNHPFDVHKDLYKAGLDVIWAATFGSDIGVTKNQLECLRGIERLDGPTGTDMAFMFPTAADPEDFTAIMTLAESVEIPMSSPMPRIHHKMALRFLPSLASATKMKDKLIKEHINRSGLKFSEAKADDTRCALDLIIRREILIAGKEGRAPAYDTQVIKDELGEHNLQMGVIRERYRSHSLTLPPITSSWLPNGRTRNDKYHSLL